jgi:hypothetical protein
MEWATSWSRRADEMATVVAALRQAPADGEQQLGDGTLGVGGQQFGEQPPPVHPQRGHQQVGLGTEMGVQGPVAHPGRRGDVGDPRAVVAVPGEDVRGGQQQPVPGLGGGDARDAAHP